MVHQCANGKDVPAGLLVPAGSSRSALTVLPSWQGEKSLFSGGVIWVNTDDDDDDDDGDVGL